MKKLLALMLSAAFLVSVAACGGGSGSMTKGERLVVAEGAGGSGVGEGAIGNKANAMRK